jgi:probable rRNA maturation factor
MSHVVDVDAEGVRVPLARERVVAIARAVLRAEGVRDARLSITFVDDRRIASLNRRHLGHRGATDVISFTLARPTSRSQLIGDIYIAPDVARRNAAQQGVGVREELTRLVVHGTLHVLGFDHPEGHGRRESLMWRRQEKLVESLTRGTARRAKTRRARSAA